MLFEFSHRDYSDNMSINLYTCGKQTCDNNHAYGPAVRSGYLIHLVIDGKGIYKLNDKTYHLEKNQGFLIEPNELMYYEADRLEPWTYIWIGFTGTKVKDYLNSTTISSENPVFSIKENSNLITCVQNIINASKINANRNLMILSKLYEFFYILCEEFPNIDNSEANRMKNYIEEALLFMQLNYADNISIQDVAEYLCIDRSYFHRLFKRFVNLSPQEYLLSLKIDKSSKLLINSNLKITDIARSVGYSDALLFSKTFKKHTGLTPSQFRKKHSAILSQKTTDTTFI